MSMNMDNETKQERDVRVGLERMEIARRLLIADRSDNVWFEVAAHSGDAGRFMELNWYARCRVAMHNKGSILANDTNWGAFRREIELWPSLLWIQLLTADKLLQAAKVCYNRGTGKLAMTTRTNDSVTIAQATWIPRNLRRASKLEILSWCGVIGGSLPPIQTGPSL